MTNEEEARVLREVETLAHATDVALEAARKRIANKIEKKKEVVEYDIRTLVDAQFDAELFQWFVAALAKEGATPSTALRATREAANKAVFQRPLTSSPLGEAIQTHRMNMIRSFVWWANEVLGEPN